MDAIDMKEVFSFLKDISINNNRDWFILNKDRYLRVKSVMDNFASQFIAAVAEEEPEASILTPTDCMYRFYRDTRFSADKTPYKTHFGIFVNPPRGKKSMRSGYYIHIQPGASEIGGGNVCLPSNVLGKIRKDIYDNIEEYLSIVEDPQFRKLLPELGLNLLKSAPKGFPKDWEHIRYIRPRDFAAMGPLKDSVLTGKEPIKKLKPYIRQIKRFNDFINYSVEPFDSIVPFR